VISEEDAHDGEIVEGLSGFYVGPDVRKWSDHNLVQKKDDNTVDKDPKD